MLAEGLRRKEHDMPRPALSNVTTAALESELKRRTKKLDSLKAKRDALDKQIAELEGLGTKPPKKASPKRRRKPGRKPKARRAQGKPLAQYMREVLARATKGMSLPQIEKAVRAAGYPTAAESIYNPMLKVIRNSPVFKKLARGVYGLKSTAKTKPGPKPKRAAKKAAKKTTAKKAKKAGAKKAKKTVKRKKYAVTAEQFVLGLVKGKGTTTAAINKAWIDAGRTGRADNTLNKMLKAGKIKRKKIKGARGSQYSAA